MLHVDGSSNANNGVAGILIQGPEEVEFEVTARLSFSVTNNEAEYEALILGLTYEAGARDLEVFTDSQLVAMQIEGTYETREKMMTSYTGIVKNWMDKFDKCSISQAPRAENDKADALSKFGAAMSIIRDRKSDTLLEDPIKAKRVRFRAASFTLLSGQLYKRTVDGTLMKCFDEERAEYVMREIHEFQGRKITEWCKELKIAQHFTAVANPQANGQTEVTNRTILQHLKTRLENKGS
ncbi:UNVERIFIED_CONTAM: hypothetical protein Sindi_1990500 [Sesamum indicum]